MERNHNSLPRAKIRLNSSWWKLVGDAISEVVIVGLCASFVNESHFLHTNLWDIMIFFSAMKSIFWLRTVNKPSVKH